MKTLEPVAGRARMDLGLWAGAAMLAALVTAHCGQSGDISGSPIPRGDADTTGMVVRDSTLPSDTLRLATLNMSIGFPVAHLFFKAMDVDTVAYDELTAMFARYLRGYPSERIRAMAKVIVAESLDVVGLQEVMIIRKTDTLINDFMAELVKEISAQGGPAYVVFKTVMNDTVLSGRRNGETITLDFREGNTLLVRPGFTVMDSIRFQYFTLLPIPAPGDPKSERAVDYMRLKSPRGVEFQVFNTHLEVKEFASYNNSQGSELARLADSLQIQVPIPGSSAKRAKLQVILGDLNALPGKAAYVNIRSRGFLDTFDGVGQDEGSTCCVAASALWDTAAVFSGIRIDYVMARGLVAKVFSRTNVKGAYFTAGGVPFLASDHRMVVSKVIVQ